MSQTLLSAQTEATDRQSQTMRQLGWACCAYLLVFGGAVLLWLPHAGAGLEPWMFVVCALPLLAGLALLWRDTSDARQYTLHLLTATLAVPIMLLFWAGSVEGEVESVLPEEPSLDAEQLFEGAASVQVAEMPDSGIALLRSGQFSDGSELRLTRFGSADTWRCWRRRRAQRLSPTADARACAC